MSDTSLAEREYMSLAPGVGIVPEKFRNRGYDKLEFGPGEGGLGQLLESRESSGGGDQMQAFLAGVAAGADPAKLASQLLNDTSKPRRR